MVTVTLGYMVSTVEEFLMVETKVGSGERGSKYQGHSHTRVVCVFLATGLDQIKSEIKALLLFSLGVVVMF